MQLVMTIGWSGALIVGGVVLVGVIVTCFAVRNIRGPRERAFAIRAFIFGWLVLPLFVAGLVLIPGLFRGPRVVGRAEPDQDIKVDRREPMRDVGDQQMVKIDCQDFRALLPPGDWANHTTSESYAYDLGEDEQFMAVVHRPHESLKPAILEEAVIKLYKIRLDALSEQSKNLCKFDSPEVIQVPDRFDVSVVGHDLRSKVMMRIGFFGRPHNILVVSYYDYTGHRTLEQFRERSKQVIDSVEVK